MTDRELELTWPEIKWREALPVATFNAKGMACRYCVARNGLRAADIRYLPQTIQEFHEHIKSQHPK